MLNIIHGDDIQNSRIFFQNIKSQQADTLTFEGTTLTLPDITQVLAGSGLFGETPSVFIDELLSKRKPSKDLDAIISFLNKNQTADIYIWESKEITAKQLKQLENADVKIFKLPRPVFQFLDSLKPSNSRIMLKLFHQTLQTQDEQLVFSMLIRHVRIMLALYENTPEPIEEVKRLAPWQETKLKRQSKLFSLEKLLEIHKRLYEIDLAQKTGNLNISLTQTIDFLLFWM